jgi:hypothetical protein
MRLHTFAWTERPFEHADVEPAIAIVPRFPLALFHPSIFVCTGQRGVSSISFGILIVSFSAFLSSLF